MTRLVRLNEVQYAETEAQAAELLAQGFREEEKTEMPVEENSPAQVQGNSAPEPSQEDSPATVEPPKRRDGKGGK
jgi:hypothetical protein